MKTYVINLESEKSRRAYMVEQLRNCGLDFHVIPAVDSKSLHSSIGVNVSLKGINDVDFVRSVYACSLSHIKTCQEFLTSDSKMALILEDDVTLYYKLKETIELIERNWIPKSIVMLCYYSHTGQPLQITEISSRSISPDILLCPPVDLLTVASTAAYILDRPTASRLIERAMPVNHAADDWKRIFDLGVFERLYCLSPRFVKEASFPTSLAYPSTKSISSRLKIQLRKTALFRNIAAHRLDKQLSEKYRVHLSNCRPFWDNTVNTSTPLEPVREAAERG